MVSLRPFIRKIRYSLHGRGVEGTLLLAGRTCMNWMGRKHLPRSKQQAWDQAEDANFDRTYHVETGGLIPIHRLDVEAANWVHSSAYIPTSPEAFSEALRSATVMGQVAKNVERSLGKYARHALVLYFRPEHADVWDRLAFMKRVTTTGLYALYESRR